MRSRPRDPARTRAFRSDAPYPHRPSQTPCTRALSPPPLTVVLTACPRPYVVGDERQRSKMNETHECRRYRHRRPEGDRSQLRAAADVGRGPTVHGQAHGEARARPGGRWASWAKTLVVVVVVVVGRVVVGCRGLRRLSLVAFIESRVVDGGHRFFAGV